MKFESIHREARLLNPLKGFELETQMIEYRTDPLTGHKSIILRGRSNYVRQYYLTDDEYLSKVVKDSREGCVFCPERRDQATPKFSPDLIPEGRIYVGEVCVFPSLFAHIEFNAVAILSRRHHLKLNEFTPQLLQDVFKAGLIFFNAILRAKPDVKYATLIFNYLPPAGSSIIHPHAQMMASDLPFNLTQGLLKLSREYYEKHKVNYWRELIEKERDKGDRYLGRIGNVEWFVPFAPTRYNEVRAVVSHKSNFMEFDQNDWNGLAEGMSRILRYYGDEKLSSFNTAIYSGPLGEGLNHFWAGLQMVARPGFQPLYLNDTWSLPYLLQEGEIFEAPEVLASSMRRYFNSSV